MDHPLALSNQVCFSLYRANNAMIRAYRSVLDGIGLTYPQYLVMLVMWESEGLSVKAVGERLHLDSGTLTPLLKRLEQKGLISRGRSERDERVRVLHLTDDGRLLKRSAKDIPERMRCMVGASADHAAQLATLKQLCDNMAKLLDREL